MTNLKCPILIAAAINLICCQPPAVQQLMLGENACNDGCYEPALEYCQKAIEIKPNHAQAYYLMGSVYAELENKGYD
jgi:Flp pilus assembly protein TadD